VKERRNQLEPVDFDRRSFRAALGTFATGVTIITTHAEDGKPVGITANSFSSVSLDPPLILFSLARTALSLKAFTAAKAFAVSILASDQGDLANRFAVPSGDKWRDTKFIVGINGCPVITGALANFECEQHAIHDGGDHVILVGRVQRFERIAAGEPLIFARGKFRALEEIPDASGERHKPAPLPPINNFEPWDGLG
jgi:flavin reductase (DIM6/NTAB) family NADH-FMN oxidoreductase RutF